MSTLQIVAYGKPITQGSKTRTKFAMRDSNAETLKPWRDNVRSAAIAALGDRARLEGPVLVRARFFFDRPLAHFGSGRNAAFLKHSAPSYPTGNKSGDLDKLLRATFDALTDAGMWKDDSQVVVVTALKAYVDENNPKPCVSILVTPAFEEAGW